MSLTEVASGRDVRVAVFGHRHDEPAAMVEWWPRTCLVFTDYGSWTVRSAYGSGDVDTGVLLVGTGGAEYDCGHPYGVDDRNLVVIFPDGVQPPRVTLVPATGRIARWRRELRRHLRTVPVDRDGDELDEIAWSLLESVNTPERDSAPSPYAIQSARRLRAVLDHEYRDADLDPVDVAASLGFSRTRMIHVFRDAVGVTPHRYLLERRVAHAAALLGTTDTPISEICFDSGFGSMARFHAAFRRAWGVTPTAFRESQ